MLGDIIYGFAGLADDISGGLLSDVAAVGCGVVAEMIPATPKAIAACIPAAPNFVLPSSLSARGAMLARLIDKTVEFESMYPFRYEKNRYEQPNFDHSLNKFSDIGRVVNVKYDKSSDENNAKIMEFVVIEVLEREWDHYLKSRDGLVYKKFLVDHTQIVSIVNLLDEKK